MTALKKLMDLLAKRELSELQLRQKLSALFSEDEVEEAIEHARAQKWLPSEEDMAERVAADLSRKGKGSDYINQYLEQKGLPPRASNDDDELAKAQTLLAAKIAWPVPEELQAKAERLLASRGFNEDTISRVLAR